jgi:hypothetical protein
MVENRLPKEFRTDSGRWDRDLVPCFSHSLSRDSVHGASYSALDGRRYAPSS